MSIWKQMCLSRLQQKAAAARGNRGERSGPSKCDSEFFCARMARMTISLTPEQQAWINAHVARGDFASTEEAVRELIDERIAERALEEQDDLGWAKPHVDE